MHFAFLFASIFCAVIGQLLLKTVVTRLDGVDFSSGSFAGQFIKLLSYPLFYVALSVYFSSMMFYLLAISRIDLSMAYPMVAVNYAIILVCSKIFFNEKVTLSRWIGVLVIITGVILVSRSG